jgi:hypothetical protein
VALWHVRRCFTDLARSKVTCDVSGQDARELTGRLRVELVREGAEHDVDVLARKPRRALLVPPNLLVELRGLGRMFADGAENRTGCTLGCSTVWKAVLDEPFEERVACRDHPVMRGTDRAARDLKRPGMP